MHPAATSILRARHLAILSLFGATILSWSCIVLIIVGAIAFFIQGLPNPVGDIRWWGNQALYMAILALSMVGCSAAVTTWQQGRKLRDAIASPTTCARCLYPRVRSGGTCSECGATHEGAQAAQARAQSVHVIDLDQNLARITSIHLAFILGLIAYRVWIRGLTAGGVDTAIFVSASGMTSGMLSWSTVHLLGWKIAKAHLTWRRYFQSPW